MSIYKLTIPKLGLTMEEGTLVKWLMDEGAPISPGNEVAEVETDKIANVVEASMTGVLRRKIANEGDVLPVGGLIGVVADPEVSDAEIDAFIARLESGAAETTEEEPAAEPVVVTETPVPAPVAPASTDIVEPLSRMRAAIAKTVTTSWANIPHIFVTVKIDMGKAEAIYRARKQSGQKISINDVVVKAISKAVPAFPLVNASFADKSILRHQDVNIAVAVGLDEGVVMPVINKCQGLTIQQIGAKCRELVEKAQAGNLGQEDMSGGTISISNMGMLGIDQFVAIVPPTQAAILAVGAIDKVPVVKDDQVVVARMMNVTISADHRVIDGAYAAKFLGELKRTLEQPEALFD